MVLYPIPEYYSSLTLSIISLTLFSIGFIKEYIVTKRKMIPITLLAAFLFHGTAQMILSFSYLMFNDFLHRLNWMFMVFNVMCFLLWVENMARETPRLALMLLAGILGGMSIMASWIPSSVRVVMVMGMPMYQYTGAWELLGLLVGYLSYYIVVFFIYLAFKAPRHVKRIVVLVIVVILSSNLVTMLIEQLTSKVFTNLDPALVTTLYVVRALIVALSFLVYFMVVMKTPEIMFILPFRALRLVVIHTEGGISIFTHQWSTREQIANEDLFSGMIQGISMILKEAVNKGNVREINLEEGILLIDNDTEHQIASVLLTTKSSKYLKQQLIKFTADFVKQYGSFLANPYEVSQFGGASAIVDMHFKFLPDYSA